MSKNINNLKVLAARMALNFYFNYVTVEWNGVVKAPVIKFWENRPSYEHGWDDYDYEWEGWQPDESDETFVCMLNAENLIGTSLGGMSENTNWSEMIISKAYMN